MHRIDRAAVAPKLPLHEWRTTETWVPTPPTPISMSIETGKDRPLLYFVENGVTFAMNLPGKAGFV